MLGDSSFALGFGLGLGSSVLGLFGLGLFGLGLRLVLIIISGAVVGLGLGLGLQIPSLDYTFGTTRNFTWRGQAVLLNFVNDKFLKVSSLPLYSDVLYLEQIGHQAVLPVLGEKRFAIKC